MSEILLTTEQAAARLGLAPEYLTKNRKRLGIKAVHVGRRTLRYRPQDLEDWARKAASL